MNGTRRFLGAFMCVAAVVALAATSALPLEAQAPAARQAQAPLLGGGGPGLHPESVVEITAAQEFGAMRSAGATSAAVASEGALARRLPTSVEPGLGAAWKELGPKPYISNDTTYNDSYGGTPNLGWINVSGRVTSLAADPSDATGRSVWVGTAGGGVWFTSDGGKVWKPKFDFMPSLAIGAVAVDPASPNRVFVGTGEQNLAGSAVYPGAGIFRSTNRGTTWERVPANIGGATTVGRIEIAGGKIFVGTNRGLFRSTDGGNTYSNVGLPTNTAGIAPATGELANMVTDIRAKPGNPSTITAAVGWSRGKAGSEGNGLYRSTDSGATWSRMPRGGLGDGSVTSDPLGRIALAYAEGADQDHNILWAVVQDAGLLNGRPVDNVTVPSVGGTYLNGVYRSADDGATWELKANVASFYTAPGSGLVGLAPLYMAGVQSWYDIWIAVDPGNVDRVLVGMEEIYQTSQNTNGRGLATWTTIGRYWNACLPLVTTSCNAVGGPYAGLTTHPDQHASAFAKSADGFRLYVGNDGGVWWQDPTAAGYDNSSWTHTNDTLGTTQAYNAVMSRDGTVYAGFQDNGTTKITPDGRGVMVFGGDGGDVAVDPDNPDHAIEEYVNASMYKTKDGGRTWEAFYPDVTAPQFIAPFEMDPLDANHVVLGAREVMVTTKGVDTVCAREPVGGTQYGTCDWVNVFDLGTNSSVPTCTVAVDADCPTGTPVRGATSNSTSALGVRGTAVYVGFCGLCSPRTLPKFKPEEVHTGIATNVKPGCERATTAANCWHVAAAKGLPERFITDVAIDPVDVKTIYVTVAGYRTRWIRGALAGLGRGHVFVSHNAGESFTDLTGGLPDVPANAAVVLGDKLFVATDQGVYVAPKVGGAWTHLGTGLPNAFVTDLNANPQGTKLVAATGGRGVWSYDLSGMGKTVKPKPVVKGVKKGRLAATGVGEPALATILLLFTAALVMWMRRRPAER
jgi:photosystem II stability/assembly factor-like uncharacterized protein